VFASPAPVDGPGLDFAAGWSAGDREKFELFFREPELARELRWSRAREALAELSTAAGWLERFGEQESTASVRSLELARYLALVQQDTLCRDDEGWWEDNVALLSPWGFDPAAIGVPVQLWHGGRDAAVPPSHGDWLAGRIPAVEGHLLADEDHGSIHDDHLAEAYGWLRQFA
jgi:pimeloyl-ACP methyl ester carboxylesterase